jgi:hypothetical protein
MNDARPVLAGLFAIAAVSASLYSYSSATKPQGSTPLVYVADFELPAVLPAARRAATVNSPSPAEDEPDVLAKHIISFLKADITQELKKSGYSVEPFQPAGTRPGSGVLMRGVFTEPDEYNRVRRVILGSGSPSSKLVLYVGLTNLARPDQPLYEMVPANAPGPPVETRFGPLITITSYSPVASFDLSRRPSDDDLKRVASDIAGRFAALIASNPALKQ